jgi:hypothetical protein
MQTLANPLNLTDHASRRIYRRTARISMNAMLPLLSGLDDESWLPDCLGYPAINPAGQ